MRIFILEPTNALAGGVHATAKFNQMVVRLTMQMPARDSRSKKKAYDPITRLKAALK